MYLSLYWLNLDFQRLVLLALTCDSAGCNSYRGSKVTVIVVSTSTAHFSQKTREMGHPGYGLNLPAGLVRK